MKTLFARLGAPETAPPWSLTSVIVAVIVAFVAVIAGTTIALVWLGGQSFAMLAGWLVAGIITLLFIRQTRDLGTLHLQSGQLPILFVIFICFGCAIGLDVLSLSVTGQFLPRPELLGLNLHAISALDWLFAGACLIIVQPIAEELVFRGLALPSLRATLGAWPGWIISALIYGAFHLLAYPPDYVSASSMTPIWYGLLLPFLEGLVIGAVRIYTNSTRAAIAGHAAFGLFAVVKLLTLLG